MSKIRLIFNRTMWNGAGTVWSDIKTVDVELPFDKSECGKWQFLGGEWLDEEEEVLKNPKTTTDPYDLAEIRKVINKRRVELNEGWIPDWDDICEDKYIISHSILYGDFRPASFIVNHTLPTFGFFKNEQDAIDVIDEFRDELDYYFKEKYIEERG